MSSRCPGINRFSQILRLIDTQNITLSAIKHCSRSLTMKIGELGGQVGAVRVLSSLGGSSKRVGLPNRAVSL